MPSNSIPHYLYKRNHTWWFRELNSHSYDSIGCLSYFETYPHPIYC